MENKALEILKIKKLMGLTSKLNEGFYGTNKLLLMEETGYGEAMDIYKRLLRKTTQALSEEEKRYLKSLIDEYNARFADEAGSINFEGKMTPDIRLRLNGFLAAETSDMITNVFDGAIRRAERQLVSQNAIDQMKLANDFYEDIMGRPISDDVLNADGSPISILDTLKFIYQKGGVRNSSLPLDFQTILRNELAAISPMLDEVTPVRKYVDDVIDQIDEIEDPSTVRLAPAEEIAVITNNISGIKNSLENPIEQVTLDLTDDWRISFDEDDLGLGRTPNEVRKQAIDAVMRDMESKCKVGFCKTMVAYYKKDSKKFNDMWAYIYQKLESGIKPVARAEFEAGAPAALINEYELILKQFEKLDTPLTPNDYIKLGEEIYTKMKETGQLGVFGGTFSPLTSDIRVFTSKDMLYRTLGYVTLGSDPFKGGWTFQGMWSRWWKMNLIWFPIIFTKNLIDAGKGSDDPTETALEQFGELLLNTAKNTALLGLAPGPRVFFEGAIYYMNQKMKGSKYVDYPTLVDYLNKQHGWTENQVYDNLINKGLVRTFRDRTPAYTQISGATDVYAVANGKYEIVNETYVGGIINPKIVFTPEGQLTPKKEEKTAKIDREARTEIKELIANESFISDSIGLTLLKKKNIDFDRQETVDDGGTKVTILVYKAVNTQDAKAEISINYDAWIAAQKPEIKTEENFNKYVKIKLI